MDLHHQFAARQVKTGQWIGVDEDGNPCLVSGEAAAKGCWTRSLAYGLVESHLKANWNVTMGDPPEFEIIKIHRPMKINHPW